MSRVSSRRKIIMPSVAEDAVIAAAARADADARPLTAAQLGEMVPMGAVRGRPRSAATKQLLSVRYSPEVIEFFRATGEGWQSRMDGVLRAYVSRRAKQVAR